MPQKYLSTDPNAGTPAEQGGYLSTDPNAGELVSDLTMPAPMTPVPAHVRQTPGIFARAAIPLGEAVEGGIAGIATSAFKGGDWIRQRLGMERVVNTPEAQAAMTPPSTPAGQLGYAGERALEFIGPGARVASAVKAAPLYMRALAEGATAAGVAGMQSGGDPTETGLAGGLGLLAPVVGTGISALSGAAKRAAAGAGEGGVGGAIAGAIRTAAPQEPRVMLTQALKPRSTRVGFGRSLERAIPELKAAETDIQKPIGNLDDLLEAVKAAKQKVWTQYEGMAGLKRGLDIDLSEVADAMTRSIPRKLQLEDPGKAMALLQRADVYRKRFTLQEAETLLRETNADLDSFYAMYPGAQRRALLANPEAASLNAQAEALRRTIYRELDTAGQGDAARHTMRKYGALMDVEEEALRRYNVARRQQPESLAEQLSTARAYGDIAKGTWRVLHGDITGAADIAGGHATRQAAKFMKEQQTTDALIRRAFESVEAPAAPTAGPVRGYLESGPVITPPPADTSYARGVPADYARREVRGVLPPGRETRVMPSGPDRSFVRGVPAEYPKRPVVGELPAGSTPMPPVPSHSSVRGVQAKSVVQRDPRTGRMRRVYTGEPK